MRIALWAGDVGLTGLGMAAARTASHAGDLVASILATAAGFSFGAATGLAYALCKKHPGPEPTDRVRQVGPAVASALERRLAA